MGVTANILQNEFLPNTFPCDEEMQMPYLFDTPLEVVVELQLDVSAEFYTTFEFHGYMKGYTSLIDFVFPCVQILRQVVPDQGGYVFWSGRGINWDSECYWEYNEYTNGVQTGHDSGDTIPTNVISTFYYGGSLPDGTCTIYHCNIPIIYDRNDDMNFYAWYQNGAVNPECPYWWQGNGGVTPRTGFDPALIPNAGEEIPEDPRVYEYVSVGIKGTWDIMDVFTQDPTAETLIKGFRVKFSNDAVGKFSFYEIPYEDGDTDLKWGIAMSDTPIALYYTYDGESWITPPSPALPFQWVWRTRENEVGTFYSNIGGDGNNNVPIFEDRETALEYIRGNISIKDAKNYDKISGNYPIENNTEYVDEETAFGQVYTRAFFSQQYICGVNAIQEISNALFDTTQGGITGLFDDIKKGLEMYGEGSGVINAVQSCMFFPLDLTEVFTSVQSQNYIYFGGYKFDMQNSVNKIIYPNGYKDFGSFDIKETFGHGNARNYAPYQRLYCYLPYIGFVQLDIAKYLGKTANVRYYFDTRTGCCLATITANGVLIDYFNGQCGVSMPITLTDYSRYAQTQIQTLLSGGANLGGGGNVGEMVKSGANNFVGGLAESGAVGLGTVAVGGLAMAGAVQGAKTLYGLTQNNINNFNVTKGASSSMLNQYLPQDVLFWFEVQDADETPNEQSLQGYPSNASGTIQSFSGYLEVDTVNLICGIATDDERAEIIAYLKSGVIL